MYDLTVKTHMADWKPVELLTADGVVLYIKDSLEMLGQSVPAAVLDPEFPVRLDQAGTYELTIDDDIRIDVWAVSYL